MFTLPWAFGFVLDSYFTIYNRYVTYFLPSSSFIWTLVFSKRSYKPKQTCCFQLQACLSMYDLLVDTRHLRVNTFQYPKANAGRHWILGKISIKRKDVFRALSNIYSRNIYSVFYDTLIFFKKHTPETTLR